MRPQIKAYNHCRKLNFKKYDYLIFYDIDEFIYLRHFTNIKDFLVQKIFDKCQRIELNHFLHTDNNLLYYDNRTVVQRFPKKDKRYLSLKKEQRREVIKSILKGNIEIRIHDIHILNSSLIGCDGFGNIRKNNIYFTNKPDYYYNYIDHYYTKSTEEFVNKIMRGCAIHGLDNNYKMRRINYYFKINDITLNKINYIEKKTKFNLTNIRMTLKKYKKGII